MPHFGKGVRGDFIMNKKESILTDSIINSIF
jgi:hypothetical protein